MYEKILIPLDQGIDAERALAATHGRTGMARLFLGSVAEEVLRRSEVPVLLVRQGLPVAA